MATSVRVRMAISGDPTIVGSSHAANQPPVTCTANAVTNEMTLLLIRLRCQIRQAPGPPMRRVNGPVRVGRRRANHTPVVTHARVSTPSTASPASRAGSYQTRPKAVRQSVTAATA
jgi:hypothetical protein